MDVLTEVAQLIDISIALALMVWLYDGLRKRHWQKQDEWDAERNKLIAERQHYEKLANGHASSPYPAD